MQRQTSAYLHAATAVVLWSTAATAFKLTLRHVSFLTLLVGSSGVSLLFLSAAVLAQGKLPLLKGFGARDWLSSAALGFLNPFLYYVILFKAYSILTAQEALALNYTWPVMLVLLSVPLLGQPLTLRGLGGMLVSFSGVAVIATGGNLAALRFTNPEGVALALSSAVVWALYWIGNVRSGGRDETVKLLVNFLFGFLFVMCTAPFLSDIDFGGVRGVVGCVYVGLFEMGVTFILWLRGLRLSERTEQVGVLVYASPFLSLVFIGLIVGERIALSTLAGLVLIVAGILLVHVRRR